MKITRRASAKINLMLHVVGRLPDGYHNLQSLVAFADVGDQVTVEKADAFHLTVDGPFAGQVPLTFDNIMTMAARWLAAKYPGINQAHVHLTKNLPVASGIGGGSSDAAATIAVLLQLFGIAISKRDEEALILASGELGADIPMCLAHQFGRGPMMWIEGSGRETLPMPVNASLPGVIVLVNPGVPVFTSVIFKKIHPPYTSPQDFQSVFEKDFQGNLEAYLMAQKNDLTEAAIAQEPKIEKIIEVLQNAPECYLARMSGTGATCFALFKDEGAAKAALMGKMPKAWGAVSHQLLSAP